MEARPWASPRAATTIFVNPFYEVAEVPRSEFGTRVTRGERVRDEETSFLRTILRFRAGGWNEDDGSSKRSSSFESDRPSLIKRTAGGFDTFLPGVVGLSRRSRPSSLLPRLNLVQLKIHQFMQTIGLLSAADERSVPKWNPSASRKA